jgi:hypothetical protein
MDDRTDGWMTGQMDGWKASFRPRRPLIYVSFSVVIFAILQISSEKRSFPVKHVYFQQIFCSFVNSIFLGENQQYICNGICDFLVIGI